MAAVSDRPSPYAPFVRSIPHKWPPMTRLAGESSERRRGGIDTKAKTTAIPGHRKAQLHCDSSSKRRQHLPLSSRCPLPQRQVTTWRHWRTDMGPTCFFGKSFDNCLTRHRIQKTHVVELLLEVNLGRGQAGEAQDGGGADLEHGCANIGGGWYLWREVMKGFAGEAKHGRSKAKFSKNLCRIFTWNLCSS